MPMSPPNLATLTPRVDALRQKLIQERGFSSARKERKKSLEGSSDARSTIEGMLTARKTARKEGLGLPMQGGPPDWFTAFKQGMESRVSQLEEQLDEKDQEVEKLRERIEVLEAAGGGSASTVSTEAAPVAEVKERPVPKLSLGGEEVPSVPKLSLGGSTEEAANKGPVPDLKVKAETKIGSPKTRPATAKEGSPSPKGATSDPAKNKARADTKKKKEGGWK